MSNSVVDLGPAQLAAVHAAHHDAQAYHAAYLELTGETIMVDVPWFSQPETRFKSLVTAGKLRLLLTLSAHVLMGQRTFMESLEETMHHVPRLDEVVYWITSQEDKGSRVFYEV